MIRSSWFLTALLTTAIALLMAGSAPAEEAKENVDFEKQILPIFHEHCVSCHGEKKGLGKLRLHTAAALKKKWDADAHLIVVGEPEKSDLYERLVLPADNKKRMPKKADPLPQEKIDLIGDWIKQGAVLPAAEPAQSATAPPSTEPAGDKPAE
ncbi:MAG: hypothetical protein L0Z07_00900 [Planctomycetes bacterium]|nr:hypothetical protein [Planctomycetota bacterium]